MYKTLKKNNYLEDLNIDGSTILNTNSKKMKHTEM
jgi:hypothetical protein